MKTRLGLGAVALITLAGGGVALSQVPATQSGAENGRAVYAAQCAACHAPGRDNRLGTVIPIGEIGTDPERLAMPLSFLHHYCRAPDSWRARALPERYAEMNLMSKEAIDPKAALRSLPPLIKGYLRLGCYIGDGAVIDRQFGTTDVLIILPVSVLNSRYIEHFGGAAEPRAA